MNSLAYRLFGIILIVVVTSLPLWGDETVSGDLTVTGRVITQGTAANYFYALAMSRSGSGSNPDIYDKDGYNLVLGASSSSLDQLVVDSNGHVGIGTGSPLAKLSVHESSPLGSSAGDVELLTHFAGITVNKFQNQLWLLRDAAGSDWYTARLHDGISVDSSFHTPGTDTRTWWERDPSSHLQSWGSSGATYMTLKGGNLGIGTVSPGNKLEVNGTIRSKEVIVETTGWPDYVFEDGYDLPTLDEVESHIEEEGHLPGVSPAEVINSKGQSLGETQRLMMQKIEELTLYVIELKKESTVQERKIENLTKEIQTK